MYSTSCQITDADSRYEGLLLGRPVLSKLGNLALTTVTVSDAEEDVMSAKNTTPPSS